LLELQNNCIETYLVAANFNAAKKQACATLCKSIYQTFLMMKSIEAARIVVSNHRTFAQTSLATCQQHSWHLFQELLDPTASGPLTSLDYEEKVRTCRAQIKMVQLTELNRPQPDLLAIIDYSSYLYHYVQLWKALVVVSHSYKELMEPSDVR